MSSIFLHLPHLLPPTMSFFLNKNPQVMQHITYNEWLPIILGSRVLEIFELNLLPRGHYQVQSGRKYSTTRTRVTN